MKHLYLSLLLCLPACVPLSAQGETDYFDPEPVQVIFPLPARVLERLLDNEVLPGDLPDLGAPLPDSTQVRYLPEGHFLQATIAPGRVSYRYLNTHRYRVEASRGSGKFQLRLYDSDGVARDDARVEADGKPVRYRRKFAAYQRRDWRVGRLKIIVGTDTLFHGVDEEINVSRFIHDWRVVKARQPVRLLLKPYYFGRTTYHFFKDGILDGYWYNYPFRRTIQRIFNARRERVGYVATNQPKYRPGDSLRVSAYLTTPKGRPLRAAHLTMTIRGGGKNKKFTVPRGEPGRYAYATVIPADWPLDERYRIGFDRGNQYFRPSVNFVVEDYELDEYELTLKASEDMRTAAATWLDLYSKDVNGHPLPDATITVDLLVDRVSAWTDSSSLTLPDTLWHYVENTDNQPSRRLTLPDSLFPRGYALDLKANVRLTAPSGEYQEQSVDIKVDRRYPFLPDIKVRGDSVYLRAVPVGADPGPLPDHAILQAITTTQDTSRRTLGLPAVLPLDHRLAAYALVLDGQTETEDLTELAPYGPRSPLTWTGDTVRINFANAHRQRIAWRLFHDEEVLLWGETNRATLRRRGGADEAVVLRVRYYAGGEWQDRKYRATAPRPELLTAHKNLLSLRIEQPEQVRPGATVRVAVVARDQRGKPARNVRLTTGVYNARFEDDPVRKPEYLRKFKRHREKQSYRAVNLQWRQSAAPPAWMVRELQLDTHRLYNLYYPAPDYRHLRDLDTLLPAGLTDAHLALFLYADGRPVPIRTIYANDRLVYFFHNDLATPYSVPLHAGLNRLSVRTDEHRYEREVLLPKRTQTVLCFDPRRFAGAGWTREAVEEWTDEEVRRIQGRVFSLKGMPSFKTYQFRTPDFPVVQTAIIRSHQPSVAGLIRNGSPVDFWMPDGDSLQLAFERGASYRITRDRDRLYPLTDEQVRSWCEADVSGNFPRRPGLPSYTYSSPKFRTTKPFSTITLYQLPTPIRERGRLQIGGAPKNLVRLLLSPRYSGVFYNYLGNSSNGGRGAGAGAVVDLKPGEYDLLYHLPDDRVTHQRISVKADQFHFLRYNPDSTNYYNSFEIGKGYSGTKPPPVDNSHFEYDGKYLNGTVWDTEENEPLIGVNILIEGTNTGTVSDFDGNWRLEIPTEDFTLVYSYTGYETVRQSFYQRSLPTESVSMGLQPGARLEEVIVVGYGSVLKKDVVGSVSIVADATTSGGIATSEGIATRTIDQITGVVAGVSSVDKGGRIYIRGSRSNAVDYYVDGIRVRGVSSPAGATPLYIIDGVVYDNLDHLPPDQALTLTILKTDEATAIYGARAANGVVIVTLGEGTVPGQATAANLPPPTVRTKFADYAAFTPHLLTDDRGRAEFDVSVPDDITAWNTFAVGQDRRRRVGFTLDRTESVLPLQAQLYLPRFLVEGDSAAATGLAINRLGEDQRIRLQFTGNAINAAPRDTLMEESVTVNYAITAPERAGLARGLESAVGERSAADTRAPLTAADSLEYTFSLQSLDDATASDGERRALRVFPKGTEMVSGELFTLGGEPLKIPTENFRPARGPVTLQLFGNRIEQLLGDVEHLVDYPYSCTEQTASRLIGLLAKKDIQVARGMPFERERDITRMLRRLEKLRRPDGGFGWWPTSERSSGWITLHVFRALSAAAAAGYPVVDLQPVRRYLLGNVNIRRDNDRLRVYLELAERGNPPTAAEMKTLDTIPTTNDYRTLALLRLHQLRGDTVDLDSVLAISSTHAVSGRYWGEERPWFWRQPTRGRLTATLLAHRILRAGGNDVAAEEAVRYLLGKKIGDPRPGGRPLLGTNTLESALLIRELLPTLLAAGSHEPPRVEISGPVNTAVSTFPFQTTLAPAAAAETRLSKSGSAPLPVSVFQRWFEREPTPNASGFSLTTRLLDARDRPLAALTVGETAYLEVTVTVRDDADYVLIEVPIPAGCSYQNRSEPRGPRAVHRAYERDRVAIFCDKLPAGTYRYRIALAPRFNGHYTLNPARAEMQYVPTVNGNGELWKVSIRER